MINTVLKRKKEIFIIFFFALSPYICVLLNYIVLTLSWLGRYTGTFLRMLYALTS